MEDKMRTAWEDQWAIDLRRKRAQQLTAYIMHAIGKYITDDRSDYRRKAHEDLYELLYSQGVEVLTDADRLLAGLPVRGNLGWTPDELRALEDERLKRLTTPMPPVVLKT
jgi:hypothetical protein